MENSSDYISMIVGLLAFAAMITVIAMVIRTGSKNRKLAEVEYEPEVPVSTVPISAEQRKDILEQNIAYFAQQGWRVSNRTDTTAQLQKTQQASCIVALLLAFLMILPGLLYLIFYRGTSNLYLTVNQYGKVDVTRN